MGFIAYSTFQPEVELLKIGVQRKHRRHKIGNHLFSQMVSDLNQQDGFEKIFLEVRSNNHPAIAFYQTLNFKKTGLRRNYYSDPIADAIILIHRL